MKNVVALLALAASLGEVSATWKNTNPFKCPDNTDNQCEDKQKGGFSWGDLNTGSFGNYGGFNFNGWTCKDSFGKRDQLTARTFGNKAISGSCGPNKAGNPNFGRNNNQFSIKTFDIVVEFDCDLEFHYDMPDGSACKHRSSCSKSGTTVKNTQCGGATSVTIVYPPQPNKPKDKCDVDVHQIDFDCEPPKTPEKPKTTKSVVKTTTKPAPTTLEVKTTSKETPKETTTSKDTPKASTTSKDTPKDTTTTSKDVPKETTTSKETPKDTTVTSVAPVPTTTPVQPVTTVTTYDSTSTVFTTVVSTITSCGPTVPNCPAGSATVTTVTVAVSTTICPVTETIIRTTESAKPEKPTTVAPPAVVTTTTKPETPIETLPCPDVVPACLNTWIFSIACEDNTDSACFCPEKAFVENIFTCIYAHGKTDTIISQAVIFFQGICAGHVPENPAIVTGADITKVITVTASPTIPAAQYTTVVVTATTVVPCETNGSIIPSSSTTKTIQSTATIPNVGLVTSNTDVVVIPAPTTSVTRANTPTPVITPVTSATGTGRLPATTTTGRPVVNGAARKVGGSFGLVMAILAAVAL